MSEVTNKPLHDDDLISVAELTSLEALQAFTDAFIGSFHVDLGNLNPDEKSRLIRHATAGLQAALKVARKQT
jgi:hypothetical protein